MKLGITFATLAALLVGISGLLVAPPGQDGAPAKAQPAAGKVVKASKVDIADFKYQPPSIAVSAGAKVTFTNSDTAPHTATSRQSGIFDSGDLRKGDSKVVTLNRPGTYAYYCSFHEFMKGEIKVTR